MKVEDPNALRFILQDELYLLDEDKSYYNTLPDRRLDQKSEPHPPLETLRQKFNYLGANKKNFLIVVHYPAHEFIADDHLSALESILDRKGHNRDDVAILNIAKNASEYKLLITHFEPKTLLILGQESIPAGMEQPEFNLRKTYDGINILYTFSFDAMMISTDNKKAFWEQMKAL